MGKQAHDKIVDIAVRAFDVPVSTISVDGHNCSLFSISGRLGPTDLLYQHSFSTYVTMSGSLLVIEDATEDDRFKDNSLVVDPPHIRFYAGAPITLPDGRPVGSLSILDDRPHDFDQAQQALLDDLAVQVSILLVMERQIEELKTEKVETKEQKLLPICAWCHRIRDDDKHWHRVDSYLLNSDHLAVSHAVCPDCSDEINPPIQ